jgi:hypothetical protein
LVPTHQALASLLDELLGELLKLPNVTGPDWPVDRATDRAVDGLVDGTSDRPVDGPVDEGLLFGESLALNNKPIPHEKASKEASALNVCALPGGVATALPYNTPARMTKAHSDIFFFLYTHQNSFEVVHFFFQIFFTGTNISRRGFVALLHSFNPKTLKQNYCGILLNSPKKFRGIRHLIEKWQVCSNKKLKKRIMRLTSIRKLFGFGSLSPRIWPIARVVNID